VPTSFPLLSSRAVRIDVGGAPTLERLSFEIAGEHARVLVVGAPRVLFDATCGIAPVAHGELSVQGLPAHEALARRTTAGAPLDPAMPPRWSVRDYVTWSARLAGHSRADAALRASEAIARMRLEALATSPVVQALSHVRRATVLAAAFATGATCLLVEDPMSGLPDDVARPFARLVLDGFGALDGVRVVIFAGRTSLTSPLVAEVDEVLVLAGSDVVAQGAPSEVAARARSFAVRLSGELDAFAMFRDRASERGVTFEADGARVIATLPEGVTTGDLLGIALDARAVIVELRPLARGFV
jgi:ABC-type multidrug transport system ATPase subunit